MSNNYFQGYREIADYFKFTRIHPELLERLVEGRNHHSQLYTDEDLWKCIDHACSEVQNELDRDFNRDYLKSTYRSNYEERAKNRFKSKSPISHSDLFYQEYPDITPVLDPAVVRAMEMESPSIGEEFEKLCMKCPNYVEYSDTDSSVSSRRNIDSPPLIDEEVLNNNCQIDKIIQNQKNANLIQLSEIGVQTSIEELDFNETKSTISIGTDTDNIIKRISMENKETRQLCELAIDKIIGGRRKTDRSDYWLLDSKTYSQKYHLPNIR